MIWMSLPALVALTTIIITTLLLIQWCFLFCTCQTIVANRSGTAFAITGNISILEKNKILRNILKTTIL
jgi:hypothetical protein